jgi:hypothetical protein
VATFTTERVKKHFPEKKRGASLLESGRLPSLAGKPCWFSVNRSLSSVASGFPQNACRDGAVKDRSHPVEQKVDHVESSKEFALLSAHSDIAGSTSNRPSWHHWLAGEGVGLGEAAELGDAFGAGNPVGLGEVIALGQGVGLGEGDVIAVGGAIWLAYDIGSFPGFLVSTFLTGGLIPSPR